MRYRSMDMDQRDPRMRDVNAQRSREFWAWRDGHQVQARGWRWLWSRLRVRWGLY